MSEVKTEEKKDVYEALFTESQRQLRETLSMLAAFMMARDYIEFCRSIGWDLGDLPK